MAIVEYKNQTSKDMDEIISDNENLGILLEETHGLTVKQNPNIKSNTMHNKNIIDIPAGNAQSKVYKGDGMFVIHTCVEKEEGVWENIFLASGLNQQKINNVIESIQARYSQLNQGYSSHQYQKIEAWHDKSLNKPKSMPDAINNILY